MKNRNRGTKSRGEQEVFCYESETGEICLEFGEAAISFSKKRFLEFADKLNYVRESVLIEYLQETNANRGLNLSSYRI